MNVYGVTLLEFTETPTLRDGVKLYLQDGVKGNPHPNEGIQIRYTTREEWRKEPVPEEYLLVETYRLDGNAMPGNELWMDKVSRDYGHPSFDVRHSAIPFIHNALINGTRLCGRNLKGYSSYGVCDWTDIHWVKW